MSSIQPRWFHASTLINTTIFFSGGTTGVNINKTTFLDETLALDLSQSWSIDNPLFTTLPQLSVPVSGHSMDRVPGTTQLLVAGGELLTNQTISPIQLYDAAGGNTTQWSSVSIPANATNTTTPFHRLYHTSITTGKDGVLLHGGYQSTVANGTVVSSLVTLNPSNNFAPLSTAPVSKALNPPALARHTMTLTADGKAIILGGINSTGILANLSMAYIMDTQATNAEWKLIPLLGKPPDPRVAFSTVMVNTTTLLVYGGTSDYKAAFWVTFYLDLPSLTWSAPNALGPIPRRWGHTATMAGNIMVVSFGKQGAYCCEFFFLLCIMFSGLWRKEKKKCV
ncbi:hypothetical protein EDD21DRAFT_387000 [Dissophora ornata]|nr:hypothetical protein EDD21DRAFT_387000 [Dissophora ornata]